MADLTSFSGWNKVDKDWRHISLEKDEYYFVIKGEGKYEFHWVVFYKKEEVASSKKFGPCKSQPECLRILDAIYQTHKLLLN